MTPATAAKGLAYKWRVQISLILVIFMVIFNNTVINIVFHALQDEFSELLDLSQWALSVYVLAFGISTPLAGFLGDRFGIKQAYLGGLSLFIAGSLLCGLSPTLPFFIFSRMLQGIGVGITLPLVTALLLAAFPKEEQGMALGNLGIALILALAAGPIVGGWFVDLDHWRWVFWLNVPIGIPGLLLGYYWLQATASTRQIELDWQGLIASSIGFGAILHGTSIAARLGWASPEVLTFLGLGGMALVGFAMIELYVAKSPLLELRLFQNRTFTVAVLAGWMSAIALYGAEFLMPLYLQVVRGYSAAQTGVILLPLALVAGITTPLAGVLYDRVGARLPLLIGFAILVHNNWALSRLTSDAPITWLVLLLALRGFAFGMTLQTTLVAALATIVQQQVSRGSALVNATRQIVQSVAVAVFATVLLNSVPPELNGQIKAMQATHRGDTLTHTDSLCAATTSNLALSVQESALTQQYCHQYLTGLTRSYTLTFYAALLCLLISLLLPGWPGPTLHLR